MNTSANNKMNTTILNKLRKSRTVKGIAVMLILSIVSEIIAPTAALALTSGAVAPEFSSFEPVATTDMVNDFTGSFNYNIPVVSIPGTDGGGYAMSLSYHAGGASEEEGSWVGHGFTLNPGAIVRNKRGVVDEYNGQEEIQYNKTKPNWTQISSFDFNMELNSQDQKEKNDEAKKDQKEDKTSGVKAEKKLKIQGFDIGGGEKSEYDQMLNEYQEGQASKLEPNYQASLSLKHAIRYNNYSGFNNTNSFGISYQNIANLNVSNSGGSTTMGFSVNPWALFSKAIGYLGRERKDKEGNVLEDRRKIKNLNDRINLFKQKKSIQFLSKLGFRSPTFSQWTHNAPSVSYSVARIAGHGYNYSASLQVNVWSPVGFQFGIQGHLNYQATEPVTVNQQYGYLNSPGMSTYNVGDGETGIVTDFQLEKESTFNKHDNHLGIPFNTADIFSASGNDVSGGFQFYHNQIGHFYPNQRTTKQKIEQVGFEIGIGGTFQVGLDVGVGFQKTVISDWDRMHNQQSEIDELDFSSSSSKPFLRFQGDHAGKLRYSDHDNILCARVGGSNFMNRKLDMVNLIGQNKLKTDDERRSNHIEYSVFNDSGDGLDKALDNNAQIKAYTVSGRGASYKNLIAQIGITNASGGYSVYGLPVFSKNEIELTAGIQNDDNDNISYIKTNPSIDVVNPTNNFTAVGRKNDTPWASTYLLTQTRTFDYVDLNNDGPTNDDFGGWTKFAYTKEGDTYKYRAPFKGGFYNRGRLIDSQDQTVSMSAGERETYYLNNVETKTHIAFFVTNKTTKDEIKANFSGISDAIALRYLTGTPNAKRKDGWGAKRDGTGIDKSVEPRYLEKIVLFSKDDLRKPITTTYFEYDYQLMKGTPNSEATGQGRLTLKKLWTEGGGIEGSKIAPYEFGYSYFKDYSPRIMAKYPNLLDVMKYSDGSMMTESDQNPIYTPGQLDAWGNYRLNGAERFINMQPWVDQTVTEDTKGFDPAAWQLKQITLPSGGQIHIQYEQQQYDYVQGNRAMAMVNLIETPFSLYETNKTSNDGGDLIGENGNAYREEKYGYKSGIHSQYYIDYEKLGISSNDISQYVNTLTDYFVNKKNKIYFKYLYNLYNIHNTGKPKLDQFDRASEYITGYTSVHKVGIDDGKIYLQLGEVKKTIQGAGADALDNVGISGGILDDVQHENYIADKTLPRWVGYFHALNQGALLLAKTSNFSEEVKDQDRKMLEAAYLSNNPQVVEKDELRKRGRGIVLENTFNFFSEWVGGNIKNPKKKKLCTEQNFELSYLKLPIPDNKSKRGGGVRVKRLLSYDPGIENDKADAMVYGTEYTYSEGAATNEPHEIREENALVGFIERKKQKFLNKLLNGRDSKQMEGPLGEFLLPGASIGYGKVIIKNIHNGKSSSGKVVNEFYTCYDKPFEVVGPTPLSKKDDTYRKFNLSLPLGLINLDMHKAWLTQGYLFKLNDFHGKPISQVTYGNIHEGLNTVATLSTKYYYNTPGDKVKSLLYDPTTEKFNIGEMSPGEEEDITMYRSQVEDVTNNFSLEIDLDWTLPYVISLGFGLSYQNSKNVLCQHVTSKVLRQTSQLLKVETKTAEGFTQITENIAFNKHTGEPVLTKTYDNYSLPGNNLYATRQTNDGGGGTEDIQHDGSVYSLTIPGSWIYSDLDSKSKSNGEGSNQLAMSVGNITTYGENIIMDAIQDMNTSGLSSAVCDNKFNKVLSANAVVLVKNWFDGAAGDKIIAEYTNNQGVAQEVKDMLNTRYYPFSTFVYKGRTSDALTDNIYDGGIIKSITMFDWTGINRNNWTSLYQGFWYSPTRIMAYSPNGNPLMETNVLNISSIAKYNHDRTLPILVAQNAKYDQVEFIDFENSNQNVNTEFAHSGLRSLNLRQNNNNPIITDYNFSGLNEGFTLKLWLKSNLNPDVNSNNFGKKNTNPQLKAIIDNQSYSMKKVASSGEWTLYSLDVYESDNLTGLKNIYLTYNYNNSNEQVLIDDIRIQPLDAQVNCTVYTPDKKVAAQFDDQHFGVYYEYNSRGALVRNTVETERGRKTIKEQQQNVPLKSRN